ncbi:MAG: hypothetical protein BGO07_04350 [Alphaproteobacteria bacterium 40-19]|nr:MAG: hypothetical protein BGO07_04350 [Alphaproteobacteria bacterium 40-19]
MLSALWKIKESQKMIKNLLPGLFKQNLNPFMKKEVMKAASSMIPNFDLTPYTERLKTFEPQVLFQKKVLPALLKIKEMIPVLFQKATQAQDQFYLLNGLQDQIVQGTIDLQVYENHLKEFQFSHFIHGEEVGDFLKNSVLRGGCLNGMFQDFKRRSEHQGNKKMNKGER